MKRNPFTIVALSTALLVWAWVGVAQAIPTAEDMCAIDGGTWTECGSGCGPMTCENPDPGGICPAVCVPMCLCPAAAPFWDEFSGCVTAESCSGTGAAATGDICSDTGGSFNECGSGCGPLTCEEPEPQEFCPAACVPQCECPSNAPLWDEALGCISQSACGGPEPQGCPEGITYEGCCDGNVLKYCEDNQFIELDCPDGCGFWEMSFNFYDCLSGPSEEAFADPSGVHPLNCADGSVEGEEGAEEPDEDVVEEDVTEPEPDTVDEEDTSEPVEEDIEEGTSDTTTETEGDTSLQEDAMPAEDDSTSGESELDATTPDDVDTTANEVDAAVSGERGEGAESSSEETEGDKESGEGPTEPAQIQPDTGLGTASSSEELIPVLSTETAPGGCQSGPSPFLGILSLCAMGLALSGRRRTGDNADIA